MAYINRDFPSFSENLRYGYPALQSPGYRRLDQDGVEEIYSGNLTYIEFIALVKKLWEESYPNIPIFPLSINRESSTTYNDNLTIDTSVGDLSTAPSSTSLGLDEFPAVIGYHLELRKAHTTEPKPRMRQNVINNEYTIYGQKFQNIISFTIMSKVGTFQGEDTTTTRDDLDAAVLCDEIIEAFEDFMLEFTPIFKAAGASDLVYSRRLSDSEINRDGKDVHKRTVTYMLTTEKVFAIKNSVIQHVSGDIRVWVANNAATPDISSVDGSISITQTDLFNTATPNS